MTRAATEYERVVALFERLTPEQCRRPTDCAGWDVRAMAGHMLGVVQMAASVPEMVGPQIRAQRAAKKTGAPAIDCLTAQQVQHNARTWGPPSWHSGCGS